MSRAVKGPEKRKTTEPADCPGERSIWKLEPFQTWAGTADIGSSSFSSAYWEALERRQVLKTQKSSNIGVPNDRIVIVACAKRKAKIPTFVAVPIVII
jgi:hypothetical protein